MVANEDALSERGRRCDEISPFGALTYHFRVWAWRYNWDETQWPITAHVSRPQFQKTREPSCSNNISEVVSIQRFYIKRNSQPPQQHENPFSQLLVLFLSLSTGPNMYLFIPIVLYSVLLATAASSTLVCNRNDCLRAVVASAFPTRHGSADCASYFEATVTPAAVYV